MSGLSQMQGRRSHGQVAEVPFALPLYGGVKGQSRDARVSACLLDDALQHFLHLHLIRPRESCMAC